LYVGVDLHRKRSVVAVLDKAGTLRLSRRIESRPEQFRRVFGELEGAPLAVAFEATYGWSWFADLLQDARIEAHMAHAADRPHELHATWTAKTGDRRQNASEVCANAAHGRERATRDAHSCANAENGRKRATRDATVCANASVEIC